MKKEKTVTKQNTKNKVSKPAKNTAKLVKQDNEIDTEKLSKSDKIQYIEDQRKKAAETYCPGKDSKLIVSGKLSKELYGTTVTVSQTDALLDKINKKYKWHYKDWESLSAGEDLTEEFLDRYQEYISWYDFLRCHPDRVFSADFEKRHPQQFLLRHIRIV